MFKCKKCNKYLKLVYKDVEIEINGLTIKAINAPVKQCPLCKDIQIPKIVKNRIAIYANEENSLIINYGKCEAEEVMASHMLVV
ncbi:hypothetical protein [Clostridium sp.]|uniref:hypothetical protein n=1 Tax=Clostridium sp. TaxID=1506 RepID=UPI002633B556|nr:hypothetical protein [Clostridium sp.]